MFDIELLNFNPDTPSFYVMLITALFAFFLSSIIALTYEFTTRSIYKKAHFLQSLALIGVVASMIIQAIGESVAIGLGILGALSIIRFRTLLSDPRNITFMFASLGVGIACGVLGFGIALTGTLVFCAGAVILKYSPLNNPEELIGEIKLQVPKEDRLRAIIEDKLNPHCKSVALNRLRFLSSKKVNTVNEEGIPTVEEISRENLQEFTYLIQLKKSASVSGLEASIREIEGLEGFRLNFQSQVTKL